MSIRSLYRSDGAVREYAVSVRETLRLKIK